MEALLVLLVLAFPVIAIVGLVIAIGARDRVRTLETQFATFKRDYPQAAAAAAAPAASPTGPASSPTAPAPPMRTAEPPTPAEPPPASLPVEPEPPRPAEPPPSALPAEPVLAPQPAETAVPPPPTQPTQPPQPPQPAEPTMGFEERFGTQWTVWVGGVALVLGGFFLLRYSIEQGWFGPGMRIVLGALLALVLIGAGEWARRNENLSDIVSVPSAHIPSILTAAGTAVAYADVWAAYALYEFIGSTAAFFLLGVVALGTLAAALVHGPALAGLGLIGAYVTPIIVSTDKPNFWALYLYLAAVTAAAFLLARARLWRWLAMTAVAFGVFWTLPGLALLPAIGVGPHSFHVAAGFALVATFIVCGLLFGPEAQESKIDPVSTIALAGYLAGSLLVVLMSKHDPLALTVFAALTAATVAIAWRTEAAAGALPLAGVMVVLMLLDFSVGFSFEALMLPSGTAAAIPDPSRAATTTHLFLGLGFAALFGVSGFFAQGRSKEALVPMLWSATAVFVPIATLIALYYRIYKFEQSVPFAGMALVLAALFALATEMLSRREPRPGSAAAAAIFATGSVAALALALALALEKGWLTVALALMVPGIAFVADKRPLPALRILTGVLVAGVLARIAWDPAIVGGDVGTTPIFNWLLWGYGIPAASFWLGGHILRRRADDAPARLSDAAALLFTVLLAFLEVRHYMTGGNIYRPANPLTEIALHVNVWLALAIGLERLRVKTDSMIHNTGALILTLLALVGIVFGLGIIGNPRLFHYDVGGLVFNLLMLGYLLPAVLMMGLALATSGRRQPLHSQALGLVAVLLALAYLTLQVRCFVQGPVLDIGPVTLTEIAWNVNILLVMTIALEWLREKAASVIHSGTALLVGALTLLAIVFGLGIAGNPMIYSYDVGGSVFNLIMLGYLFPAALAAALALGIRGHRPAGYSQLAAVVAVALALAYLSLQVRRFFHGPILTIGPTSDPEQYTYSAVWLVFGVVLLAIGIGLKSQAVRLASAAVVILTVLKVFFVDMHDLTGIWQSISLIGLGVVLMGIGLFYQRLLFPRRPRLVPAQT